MSGPFCETCDHFRPMPGGEHGECDDPAKRISDSSGNRLNNAPEVWPRFECCNHTGLAVSGADAVGVEEALQMFVAACDWWWSDDWDVGPEVREKFSRAYEAAKIAGAEAVGVEEAWEAYKRKQPIMYGGEREAFYAAWQASQTRDGWREER